MIAIGGPIDQQEVAVNGDEFEWHAPNRLAIRDGLASSTVRYIVREQGHDMAADLWFPPTHGFHRFIEWEWQNERDLRYYGWGEKWRVRIQRRWRIAVPAYDPPTEQQAQVVLDLNGIPHDHERIEKLIRIKHKGYTQSAWRLGYSAYPDHNPVAGPHQNDYHSDSRPRASNRSRS